MNLRTKIILILVGVIVPTIIIATLVTNQIIKPLLEEEVRERGVSAARSLISDIRAQKLFRDAKSIDDIDDYIQELLYLHPSITRIDVYKMQKDGRTALIASNYEKESDDLIQEDQVISSLKSEKITDQSGQKYWKITFPIKSKTTSKTTNKPSQVTTHGYVQLHISLKPAVSILDTFWQVNAVSSGIIVFVLIAFLGFALRKTLENDKLLKVAMSQNLKLTEQLQETDQKLNTSEKMAAMGQLTAHLAHEVGTPLNSIGGYLQLLREDISEDNLNTPQSLERVNIIEEELSKIEKTVRHFLNTTTKETLERKKTNVNSLIQRSVMLIKPRYDIIDATLETDLDGNTPSFQIAATDIEQVLMNLLTNSLHSLKLKIHQDDLKVIISTEFMRENGNDYLKIDVRDNGAGIERAVLNKVTEPFFTTKNPQEGTGLGLNICEKIIKKYGGEIEISSEEGLWTQVTVILPHQKVA